MPRSPVTLELLAQALDDVGVACERPTVDRIRTFWQAAEDGPALLAALPAATAERLAARPVTWRVRRDAVLATAVLPVVDGVSLINAAITADRWNRTEPWPFLCVDIAAQCVVARGTIPCLTGVTTADLASPALGLARATAAALCALLRCDPDGGLLTKAE